MRILRNTDEWVGLLVLVCIGLFIAAVLHAGLLSDWFRPTAQLRVVLPATGSQGLSAGADVQLLGTRVGTVRRVVVDPQRMYAEVQLDEQAEVFIRRDSKALIRKQFGLAGAAYLDISRGTGAPLDWHFAVIDAVTEPDPTENIGATVDQIKQKIVPVLDDAGRAMHALADTLQDIDQGRGNVGRLVKDDALMNQMGQILTNLKTTTDQLNVTMAQVRQMVATTAAPNGLPALLRKTNDTMTSVQKATHDLAGATPQLPAITRNAATSTADLPALLLQTQASMAALQKTLDQLRHTWPLSSSAKPEPPRLSPTEVTP